MSAPSENSGHAPIASQQDYKFRLEVFEGPLDLLLHLIKANELEISEISLAQITQQYLEYLRLMESLDLEVAGDYLVMAASLINIKLRALLPEPEEEIEEEEEVDDFMSARLLMQKLIEYRRFKEAARELGQLAHRQAQIFVREVALPKIAEARQEPELEGDLHKLLEAFSRVIKFVERRNYHQIGQEEYTTEEKMEVLRGRIMLEDRIAVSEIFEQCGPKIEMVVTLIAILELCRLKEVRVVQAGVFDEIYLRSRRDGRPVDDAQREAELSREAAQLDQLEADIVANRTGLIDDGVVEDDEDAMIEAALAEAEPSQPPQSAAPPPEPDPSPADSDEPDSPQAEIIELRRRDAAEKDSDHPHPDHSGPNREK